MTLERFVVVSTKPMFGSSEVTGPYNRPCSFIDRKLGPLIQTRSTVPSLWRPAVFSAMTRVTASAVSFRRTWTTLTPKCAFSSSPAQVMKAFVFSSPAQALKYTVWPFALASTCSHSAVVCASDRAENRAENSARANTRHRASARNEGMNFLCFRVR